MNLIRYLLAVLAGPPKPTGAQGARITFITLGANTEANPTQGAASWNEAGA